MNKTATNINNKYNGYHRNEPELVFNGSQLDTNSHTVIRFVLYAPVKLSTNLSCLIKKLTNQVPS